MKNTLAYQTVGNTCAPVTFANVLRFLFAREEIHAELLREIYVRALDEWGPRGEYGWGGTSPNAAAGMAAALDSYARSVAFPLRVELVSGDEAIVRPGLRVWKALAEKPGQVAGVARMYSTNRVPHYVLLTGVAGQYVELFDPYLEPEMTDASLREEFGDGAVRLIEGRPFEANRTVHIDYFASGAAQPYVLIDDEYSRRIFLAERTDPTPFDIWAERRAQYEAERAARQGVS